MVDAQVPPTELAQRRLEELRRVLADLDRCPHGRHEGDACAGYRPGEPMSGCEGGRSLGNPLLPTGVRVGTDTWGNPMWMPPRGHRHLPDAWRRPWRPETDPVATDDAARAFRERRDVIELRAGLGIGYHRVGNQVYGYGVQVWDKDTLVGIQPVDACFNPIGPYQVLADGSAAHTDGGARA